MKSAQKINQMIFIVESVETSINILISKRVTNPSLRISESYTSVAVKRMRRQIVRAMASVKEKATNSLKKMAGQ